MDRNRFLTIVIIAVAVLFIFNPFGRRGPVERLVPAPIGREVLDPLVASVEQHALAAEDYVLGLFDRYDIVLLGEFPKIKQQVDFVRGLVPLLYHRGVTQLGIEHALHASQAEIDAILAAPVFDEARARAVFFDFMVLWGFEEYVGILRSAWELNRSLPAGAKPFRVVGLSVRRHWEHVQSEKDIEDPAVVQRVLAEGAPERVIADTIQSEFVERGEKALVFLNLHSAVTRARNVEYEKNAEAKGLTETRRAGNIVYERLGNRVAYVPIHAPWPDKNTLSRLNYPFGGALDRMLARMPKERRRIGFDLAATSAGDLPLESDIYRGSREPLTLAEFADGYVMLGPLADYTPVTPIADFITEGNVERALAEFPGPKEGRKLSPAELNRVIVQDLEGLRKVLDQFS